MAPRQYNYTHASAYETANAALRGALAINDVLSDAIARDSKGVWAETVLDDLTLASATLLNVARSELENLRRDCWHANALLGKFGDEAKQLAQRDADAMTAEAKQ